MALGSTVSLNTTRQQLTGVAEDDQASWMTLIDAGGLVTADNSGTIQGSGDITAATRHWAERTRRDGQVLLLRIKYPTTVATITLGAKFKACGQDENGAEEFLKKVASSAGEITITPAPSTDYTLGSWRYTDVVMTSHAFDLLGNIKALVGMTQAPTCSSGDFTTAVLQGKLVKA